VSRPEDGDFLGRWSARKLRARAERVPESVPEAPLPAAEAAEPASDKTDAEILDELGLPDPDSLVKGDNFAAFLRAAVPARIRNRALRRLWVSDPVLANLDGLNDYEQDFTDAATVMPGVKTAYRVGRGLLRDEPDEPPAALADEPPETATDAPAEAVGPQDATDEIGDTAGREDGPVGEAAGYDDQSAAPPDQVSETDLRPNRMRFRFEG
jgi:Protein of unknown function (DUF3306)